MCVLVTGTTGIFDLVHTDFSEHFQLTLFITAVSLDQKIIVVAMKAACLLGECVEGIASTNPHLPYRIDFSYYRIPVIITVKQRFIE